MCSFLLHPSSCSWIPSSLQQLISWNTSVSIQLTAITLARVHLPLQLVLTWYLSLLIFSLHDYVNRSRSKWTTSGRWPRSKLYGTVRYAFTLTVQTIWFDTGLVDSNHMLHVNALRLSEVRLRFMCKIVSILIRFTQKSMLVFVFRPPIRVPNFSKIAARTQKIWRFLQSVRNDEEKNEIFTKFCWLISREQLEGSC